MQEQQACAAPTDRVILHAMFDLLPITGCCRERVHCDCVVQSIASVQQVYQGQGAPPTGFTPNDTTKPAIWQDVLDDIDYRWVVTLQTWQ